jgi:hypothetical protein
MMAAKKSPPKPAPPAPPATRAKVSQTDVPAHSLEDAIRIPRSIADHYGYKPTKPLNVAAGMGVQPNSSQFRMLAGAAIAYGLTAGGPNAPEISITPLGMRIVRPTAEGDDQRAMREALLKPRIVGEFLRKYADAPVPRNDIAVNVLVELGVPQDRASTVLELILAGAASVGFFRDIKGKRYVSLEGVAPTPAEDADDTSEVVSGQVPDPAGSTPLQLPPVPPGTDIGHEVAARRVYITHGKNRAFVDPVKKLLSFGELEPVVSVERPSVSQPVPEKIMSEMRSCGAAIIHVDAETKLLDAEANEHVVLNPNVLLEIGAAMALFGRRFILLVRDGVKLPSNLQGLFEVRYTGDTLDGDATVRLLEAIRDIKNHPMPPRYQA